MNHRGPGLGDEPSPEEGSPPVAPRAVVIVNPVKAEIARLRSAVATQEQKNGWLPSVWLETTI